jgi:hypothetical protein
LTLATDILGFLRTTLIAPPRVREVLTRYPFFYNVAIGPQASYARGQEGITRLREMHMPPKIDYSKLLGFDMVTDELEKGVDFKNPAIAAKLGAKIGTLTTKTEQPMLMPVQSDVSGPATPIMCGVGGRKVSIPNR